MDYLTVSVAALIVAALTLFSGFGLGTLLMPVFAIFSPIQVAVASTAIVHLANNVFKLALIGRKADLKVVVYFAVPGAITAILGAVLLTYVSDLPAITQYSIGSRALSITVVKIVIASLMAVFAMLELHPFFRNLSFGHKYLPLGGALSGFFGGLSGHQGALRAAFLAKAGLDTEAFVGTSVASAVVVDISRLSVYGLTFFAQHFTEASIASNSGLIIIAIMAAFIGSFIGTRLIKKITMKTIQQLVGVMLFALAIGFGAGLI